MNAETSAARWPVLVALAILVLITAVFIIEFVVSSQAAPEQMLEPLAEDAYATPVAALLASADAARGAALVETHNCVACHRAGAENHIAPAFVGVAERAATRRPPLSAPAYLYESILHPMAYVVPDYNPAMPQNYPDVLSEQELGDIIAYLLLPEAH